MRSEPTPRPIIPGSWNFEAAQGSILRRSLSNDLPIGVGMKTIRSGLRMDGSKIINQSINHSFNSSQKIEQMKGALVFCSFPFFYSIEISEFPIILLLTLNTNVIFMMEQVEMLFTCG